MKDRINEQINDLVDFEREIANITKTQAERRQDEKTYRNASLLHLNEKSDFLDWTYTFHLNCIQHTVSKTFQALNLRLRFLPRRTST